MYSEKLRAIDEKIDRRSIHPFHPTVTNMAKIWQHQFSLVKFLICLVINFQSVLVCYSINVADVFLMMHNTNLNT